MDKIYFEMQDGNLCAQHSLNALLQGPFFTVFDLATIAQQLDVEEHNALANGNTYYNSPPIAGTSQNMDDSGFFSVQVIQEALKTYNLELISLGNNRVSYLKNNPLYGTAYICNQRQHWFTIRKIGKQWFNLNSLFKRPKFVSDTYLQLYLAQLMQEGYTIFTIGGELPPCDADDILKVTPLDPALLKSLDKETYDEKNSLQQKSSVQIRDNNQEDPELEAALLASMTDEFDNANSSLSKALKQSRNVFHDNDVDFQRAIAMSMKINATSDIKNESDKSVNESQPSAAITSSVSMKPTVEEMRAARLKYLDKLEEKKNEETGNTHQKND